MHAAEREAASRAPASTGAALGTTVVSLGSATEPGLWLKTPLVDAEQPGRVTNPATGKSAADLLTERSCHAARRLLAETDQTAAEIAAEAATGPCRVR